MKKQFYDIHCIFNMINNKKIKQICTSDINVFKYNRLLHIKLDLNYVNQMKLNLTSSPGKCVFSPPSPQQKNVIIEEIEKTTKTSHFSRLVHNNLI